MKEQLLNKLPQLAELGSEDILQLDEAKFLNSSFKMNLVKDKSKGAKVSDTKFYAKFFDSIIKFEFDETCNKLCVLPSKDLPVEQLNLLNVLDSIGFAKIEFSCNENFSCLLNFLNQSGYVLEVKRKDRFFNNGEYQNEIMISKFKGAK